MITGRWHWQDILTRGGKQNYARSSGHTTFRIRYVVRFSLARIPWSSVCVRNHTLCSVLDMQLCLLDLVRQAGHCSECGGLNTPFHQLQARFLTLCLPNHACRARAVPRNTCKPNHSLSNTCACRTLKYSTNLRNEDAPVIY